MIKSGEKSLSGSGIDKITQQFHDPKGVGILSPARYEIMIASAGLGAGTLWSKHATLNTGNIEAMKRLSASCEATSFASRTVASNPNRIHGPVREMPYESVYGGDLDLTFRVGQDMFERKYFEFWMDQIIDHENNSVGYYDEYTRDIYVAQLGPDDDIVYKIVYKECYPKAVNAIDLGFEKTDDYVRQSVSIAFREYEVLGSYLVSDLAFTSMGEQSLAKVQRDREIAQQRSSERRSQYQREAIGRLLNDADETARAIPSSGTLQEFKFTPSGGPDLNINTGLPKWPR